MNKNLYRAALAKNGMSQKELAKELGICEATLVLKVRKGTITVAEANKMIDLLGIENPAELFFTNQDTCEVTNHRKEA